MALARYESVAVNTAGDVIPNATVEVRQDQPGRPVVPLFADREGSVPLGNPITTDAEGKFGFHVPGGSYYIRVFTGPSQQPFQQYVRRYQAIGTAAERDVEDLATALEAGTATYPELADLEAFVPAVEGIGGKVTTGEDAGFYHYDFGTSAWVFDRPLFDTLARMNVTGGDANNIVAEIVSGVADSAVVMLWIEAPGNNTGAVSINGKEVLTASGNSLIAGQWNEGRTYWFSDEGDVYKLRTESDVDGIATQVEAWANEAHANKNYAQEWSQSDEPISVEAGGDGTDDKSAKAWAEAAAAEVEEAVEEALGYAEEWAQSPDPISVEAGGDGATDRSSKYWAGQSGNSADEAEQSAQEAEGYAAALNLPAIGSGDAGKQLFVTDEEDGYRLDQPGVSTIVAGDGVTVDNTDPTAPVVSVEGGGADLFDTVSAALADDNVVMGYSGSGAANIVTPDQIIGIAGYRYEVAADDATDEHLTTAGGLKLYVLPDVDGFYNVQAFGAIGDGITDDSAATQAAFDMGFGVLFPANHKYEIRNINVDGPTGLLEAPRFIKFEGATLQQSQAGIKDGSPMFILAENTNINALEIEGSTITVTSGGGHVFEVRGSTSHVKVNVPYIIQLATNRSIIRSFNFNFFFNTFHGKYWNITDQHTVAAIDILTTGNQASENKFYIDRLEISGTAATIPFMRFRNDVVTGLTLNYGNIISLSGPEKCNGGVLLLSGTENTVIEKMNTFDNSTIVNHVIQLGQTGNPCVNTKIRDYKRNGGTLSSGIKDIMCTNADFVFVECPAGAGSSNPALIDLNGQENCKIVAKFNATVQNSGGTGFKEW